MILLHEDAIDILQSTKHPAVRVIEADKSEITVSPKQAAHLLLRGYYQPVGTQKRVRKITHVKPMVTWMPESDANEGMPAVQPYSRETLISLGYTSAI